MSYYKDYDDDDDIDGGVDGINDEGIMSEAIDGMDDEEFECYIGELLELDANSPKTFIINPVKIKKNKRNL